MLTGRSFGKRIAETGQDGGVRIRAAAVRLAPLLLVDRLLQGDGSEPFAGHCPLKKGDAAGDGGHPVHV